MYGMPNWPAKLGMPCYSVNTIQMLFSGEQPFGYFKTGSKVQTLAEIGIAPPWCQHLYSIGGHMHDVAFLISYSSGKGQKWRISWGDYTDKILSMLLATTIIWINDPYDYAESIKDDEHQLHFKATVQFYYETSWPVSNDLQWFSV